MNSSPDSAMPLPQAIFAATRVAMIVLDQDMTIVSHNPAFSALSGYNPAQGQEPLNLLTLFPEEEKERIEGFHRNRRNCQGPAPEIYETRMITREGELRYLLVTATLLAESSLSVVTFLDITSRKESETNLAKSQVQLFHQHDKLNRLFQQVAAIKNEWVRSMDCIGDWLVLTDPEGRIRRCNVSFKNFFDRQYTDLIGTPLADLLGEFSLSAKDEQSSRIEAHHDQRNQWYALDTYPFLDEHGQENGAVITARNITETKLMTQKLQQAYADLQTSQSHLIQQEKLATIGQLAAGVAHEINNPMGFITSNLATLQRYLTRLTDFVRLQTEMLAPPQGSTTAADLAKLRKEFKLDFILDDLPTLLEESLEGADRVSKIVKDLKTFSRVDKPEMDLANLNDCLESTISMVWNELKYKATLEKQLQPLPPLRCYPNRLNQVFMNLLVNAAQAIETQGVISVRSWEESGTILVAIGDNGCGIPADIRQRLFEPFFTTKEAGKGTGLGLSIAADIIRDHGGEIRVDSEPGKGTVFTISLPAVPGSAGETMA